MTIEEAIKWIQEEKASFERAPDLNGCPMTECWQKAIDVYDMAISALRQQEQPPNAPLTLDELLEIDKASEPVYFYIFRSDISGWQIIEQITDSKIIFRGRANIYVPIKGLGVSYNLYRQKPEEI